MEMKVKEEFRESRDNNNNNNNHKRIDHEEKAREELRRGLAAVNQLRVLVAESQAGHCLGKDEATLQAHMKDHSSIILSSFDSAISILKRIASRENKDGGDNTGINLISSDNGIKRSYYNRRTTQPEPVKTITSVTATEDGYTWRKYGQKPIVNAKYPREYYRCGHKDDVGCSATKQVQMNDENPNKYIITYYGNHTCQARLGHNRNASQLHALIEGSTPEDEFANMNMLNFEFNSSNKLSSTPVASNPEQAGLNPLSKIFSSLSANAPISTLNKEKVIIISPDKEKLFINVPNDHQFELPTLSSDKSLSNLAGLVAAMETPPEWYFSCMFSPESNDVAVPVENDYYFSFFADCDDHQLEGSSQDNLHRGEQ